MEDNLMEGLKLPDWATPDTRFYKNTKNQLWLEAKQYDHMPYPFNAQVDKNGQKLNMWEKAPAIRLNIPSLAADVTSKRLFVGKHAPMIDTKSESLDTLCKSVVKDANLLWFSHEMTFQGQTGSCAVMCSINNGKPTVEVVPGVKCWPELYSDKTVAVMRISYCIRGYEWENIGGPMFDCNGADIERGNQYWYVRIIDEKAVTVMAPIPTGDSYNPETYRDRDLEKPVKEMTSDHGLGFVPVVWIKNSPSSGYLDGMPTWYRCLDNCYFIDATLSQFGRGFNYMGNPTLSVKGNVITKRGQGLQLGPQGVIQLPLDRKDASGASYTGSEAKIIEMQGDGLKIGMENFVEKIKAWTEKAMMISQTDPNNIKGHMSGTALMVLDEPSYNLVEFFKTPYGNQGFLKVCEMLLVMMKVAEPKDFEDAELDWPRQVEPEPQEIQYLEQALESAVKAGLMRLEEGSELLGAALDKTLTPVAPEANPHYEDPNAAIEQKAADQKKAAGSKAKPKPKKAAAKTG